MASSDDLLKSKKKKQQRGKKKVKIDDFLDRENNWKKASEEDMKDYDPYKLIGKVVRKGSGISFDKWLSALENTPQTSLPYHGLCGKESAPKKEDYKLRKKYKAKWPNPKDSPVNFHNFCYETKCPKCKKPLYCSKWLYDNYKEG